MLPVKDIVERRTFPAVNLTLIAVNTLVFLWSLTDFDHIVSRYGFTPLNWSLLTIFTSMFLHGGFDHLIGNMWYLWIFGDNVEDRLGHFGYLIFYLSSGLAATFIHYMSDPISNVTAVGASGAISGVIGAYAVFYPRAKVLVLIRFYLTAVSAFTMIGLWFLMQLVFGTLSLIGGVGSGIAYWAHIGGFTFGLLIGLTLKSKRLMFSEYHH
ncbi:MAG: rhomboid family intramembrane serine protease [Candidatus Bathyarchaeia archaeon]|nr:rhomboid family intramembrane serine protease [Candidatus Bathyarchaeota archaeon]